MPIEPSLWAEINNALGAIPPFFGSATAGSDLYEAYVWSLMLRAAKNEGALITFHTRSGAVPTIFRFRTSPSGIASVTQDYCHAEVAFGDRIPTLEAHVGIYVTGKSDVFHECDVAVLYKSEADSCRRDSAYPRSSKVIATVECKYFINSALGINLGRSYLGLTSDIYREDRFFIATQESSSVLKLFSKHNRQFELGLSPLEPAKEARLIGSFEHIFRGFKASWS